MLTKVNLVNFKCFHRETPVRLARFTLLTGANSRGKSTLIQPLLLMQQSLSFQAGSAHRLCLNGLYISLGRFYDVCSSQAPRSDPIEVGFEFTELNNRVSMRYRLGPDDDDDSVAAITSFTAAGTMNGRAFKIDLTAQDEPLAHEASTWQNLIPQDAVLPNGVRAMVNWNNTHYVSADRLGPQEYFLKHSFSDIMFVGPRGEYTGSVLLSAKQQVVREEMTLDTDRVTRTVPDQASAWLRELFGEAHLDVHSTDTNVLLLFLSSDQSPSRLYRPANVGFGYSYVLPIIVSALIAQPGQIVVVENPEAHLHPFAQAQLIRMLVRLSLCGVQVIVETHSDHVLNALRVAVSEKVMRPDDVEILFFEEHPEHYLRAIRIESDGMIDVADWPRGFFDQTEHDFARLFND